jgi:hypothetical protein
LRALTTRALSSGAHQGVVRWNADWPSPGSREPIVSEMHGTRSLADLVERSPVLLEELLAGVFVRVTAGDQEVEMGGVGLHADVHPVARLCSGRF